MRIRELHIVRDAAPKTEDERARQGRKTAQTLAG
jgi:hypothetical protein